MRDLAPGTIVDGRYSILSRLGSGGMADVYCAEDLQLGRKVALKVLYGRFASDADFVERFRREASAAAGLQHPNVVGVYDRGEWQDTYYIAMEYLEGRSLKELLRQQGPLEPAQAIEVVAQILRAARFAHQRGIVHRDLKPANVIVDDEGRVRVTDFGIARAGASDMTETGSIMGTAQYLSPEQAQGHDVGPASDLYAVGIVLYELLTGRVPFEGDSPVTIALKQVSEAPVPPSAYSPAVPPQLDAVVMRALEKDPARRFSSAEEFTAALEQVRAELSLPVGQSTAIFGAVPPDGGGEEPPSDGELAALAYPEEPPPEHREPDWRKRGLIVLGILAVLALGFLIFTLAKPARVGVPNTVGTKLPTALTLLKNKGFQASVDRFTNNAPRDTVLRQDPQPNTQADKGSTVTLQVSDGPGTTIVPDVGREPRRQAQKELQQAGFKVTASEEPSDTVRKGNATRTSPAAGVSAPRGSTVQLFVSSGAEQITVPDVTGQNVDSAQATLVSAGLKVSVSQQESDRDAGTVLSQDPGGGSQVDRGTTVAIVVAKPQTTIVVPDVTGQSQDAATSTLSGLGLSVVIDTVAVTSQDQDGIVQSQDPAKGAKVKRGSSVTISVGKFTTPTTPAPGQ